LPLYLSYAQGNNPQGTFGLGIVLVVISTVFVAMSNRFGKKVRS
jgi:hypothetical protein